MSVIDLISPATGMKLMIATKKSSAGNSARKSSRPAAPPARGSCRRPLRDRCVSPARSTTAEHATFAASGPDPVTIERRGRVPFRLSQQPVVKLQLHSAGDASHLHPNAAAALGAPGLAALLIAHMFPTCPLFAPCHPGASPASVHDELVRRDTRSVWHCRRRAARAVRGNQLQIVAAD